MVTATFGESVRSTSMLSPSAVLKPLIDASAWTALTIEVASPSERRSSRAPASAAESTADWTSRLLAYHMPTSTERPAAPINTGAAIAA